MKNSIIGFSALLVLYGCSQSTKSESEIPELHRRFFEERIRCKEGIKEYIILTPSECGDCISKNVRRVRQWIGEKVIRRQFIMDNRMLRHIQDSLEIFRNSSDYQEINANDLARYGLLDGPAYIFHVEDCKIKSEEKLKDES